MDGTIWMIDQAAGHTGMPRPSWQITRAKEDQMNRRTTLAIVAGVATTATAATVVLAEPARRDSARDEAAVIAVAHRWFTELADGHGVAACEMLTPRAREEFAAQLPGLADDCPRAVEAFGTLLTDEQLNAIRHITIRRVTVRGDHATIPDGGVEVPSPLDYDNEAHNVFVRTRAGWRMDRLA